MALALALSACEASEPAETPSRVNGLIVAIDQDDAGEIRAITVETRDQQRYEISIEPRRDHGFDLEHLEDHREQTIPVLVRLGERGGVLYAMEILDA